VVVVILAMIARHFLVKESLFTVINIFRVE
jgi:hypothetical protein